jgi:hypothetical protein
MATIDPTPPSGKTHAASRWLLVLLTPLAALAVACGRLGSPASTTDAPNSAGLNETVARWLAAYLVPPSRPGEALVPHIRFEQPWPQSLALAIFLLAAVFVIALYRREGTIPAWYRVVLSALRIALVLLAMFMLSEAVLSVDRTGLPTFVVLVDDSASTSVADNYADRPWPPPPAPPSPPAWP